MPLSPTTFKEKMRYSVQFTLVYGGVEAFFWIGLFLVALGCSFSIYLGLALFTCWALIPALLLRRVLKLDIEALDDPNDNPSANRLLRDARSSRERRDNEVAVRFAVELAKSVAIIIGVTLALGFSAELAAFVLSDRDVNGAFGSAGGILGLVVGILIVFRRIAEIED